MKITFKINLLSQPFFGEIMITQFKILFQIIKSMVTICITRNIILWTMTLRGLIIVRLK